MPRRFRHTLILCLLACNLGSLTLLAEPTRAETYFSVEAGFTYPDDLRNIDITTTGFTSLTQSDLDLDSSLLYGLRLGHYFRSTRWFGLETHAFVTQPGVKQQDITLTGPGGSTTFNDVPGLNFRVFTWTPVALTFRYPGTRLQPYLGAGPALYVAKLKDKVSGDSQSDTSLGLDAHAGIRYYLSRHWTVFLEGRYSGLTRFQFKETTNLDGIDADYSAVHALVGIGFHF